MKADCPIRRGPHGLFAHSPPAAPWVVPHGAQESLLSYLVLLPPLIHLLPEAASSPPLVPLLQTHVPLTATARSALLPFPTPPASF